MSNPPDSLVAGFEPHRTWLTGLAYRMLGSQSEAEDAVQEAWLRWREVAREDVVQPRAYLSRTVTRLCLDRLKSAQAQREVYVGPWLPEPIVDAAGHWQAGPDVASEFASDLSYALMLALERLSPLERAAFLLHDVFETGFDEIARTLGRSEAACRQLASRARERVREARPRFTVSIKDCERLAAAFLFAAQSGNADQLKQLLSEDAKFVSDGGGQVNSARKPLHGRNRIVKLMLGLRRRYPLPMDARVEFAHINGHAGCIVRQADGRPIQTVALDFNDDGHVRALYIVRNPDKLRHL